MAPPICHRQEAILTDLASVERARRLAVELASDNLQGQPPAYWPATWVLMDVNALVRRHGGRVVVFRMPLSSVQQTRYTTTARLADIEAFRRQAIARISTICRASLPRRTRISPTIGI